MIRHNLFLDDERVPADVTWITLPPGPWTIVRNYRQFCDHITKYGVPFQISFDNDLGQDEPEGRDCVRWLFDQFLDGRVERKDFYYTVHSKNPVAADWIKNYIRNFQETFSK